MTTTPHTHTTQRPLWPALLGSAVFLWVVFKAPSGPWLDQDALIGVTRLPPVIACAAELLALFFLHRRRSHTPTAWSPRAAHSLFLGLIAAALYAAGVITAGAIPLSAETAMWALTTLAALLAFRQHFAAAFADSPRGRRLRERRADRPPLTQRQCWRRRLITAAALTPPCMFLNAPLCSLAAQFIRGDLTTRVVSTQNAQPAWYFVLETVCSQTVMYGVGLPLRPGNAVPESPSSRETLDWTRRVREGLEFRAGWTPLWNTADSGVVPPPFAMQYRQLLPIDPRDTRTFVDAERALGWPMLGARWSEAKTLALFDPWQAFVRTPSGLLFSIENLEFVRAEPHGFRWFTYDGIGPIHFPYDLIWPGSLINGVLMASVIVAMCSLARAAIIATARGLTRLLPRAAPVAA